jgi:branched-chain amino acid transport system ATP-binding protein
VTNEFILAVEQLNMSYGGLRVTDNVTLGLAPFSIHGLIGPNGAGKSTLVNQITGELKSESGKILLNDQDITPFPPSQRARLGLARSYQISAVFTELTVLENVLLAVRAKTARLHEIWSAALADKSAVSRSVIALEKVGLANSITKRASSLSYGERRQLEVAMAIGQDPKVLLLDEPLAGMGPLEAERIVSMLATLRESYAILLIEHDMQAMFALANQITVLVRGQVIASGSVSEIRGNEVVRTAYLGDEELVA